MRSYSITDPGSMVIMTASRSVPPKRRNVFSVASIPTLTLAELRSARHRIAEVLLRLDARIATLEGSAVAASDRRSTSSSSPLDQRVLEAREAIHGSTPLDVRQRAEQARRGIAPSSTATEEVQTRLKAVKDAMRA